MSISINEFELLYAERQQPLGQRIFECVDHAQRAHTALEITGQLVGVTGRYEIHVSPEVAQALPEVLGILNAFVAAKKIRKAVVPDHILGDQVMYARLKHQ